MPTILGAVIEEIGGDDAKVTGVRVKNVADGTVQEIATDAVFVAIGLNPNTAIAEQLGLKLDANGYIETDRAKRTSLPRIYAAGDVTGGAQQIVNAVGDGSTAALSAFEDLAHPYWKKKKTQKGKEESLRRPRGCAPRIPEKRKPGDCRSSRGVEFGRGQFRGLEPAPLGQMPPHVLAQLALVHVAFRPGHVVLEIGRVVVKAPNAFLGQGAQNRVALGIKGRAQIVHPKGQSRTQPGHVVAVQVHVEMARIGKLRPAVGRGLGQNRRHRPRPSSGAKRSKRPPAQIAPGPFQVADG